MLEVSVVTHYYLLGMIFFTNFGLQGCFFGSLVTAVKWKVKENFRTTSMLLFDFATIVT